MCGDRLSYGGLRHSARLLYKPFVNLPHRFVLKRLHKAFPSGPAPLRFGRIGRILVFLEGLVIRTAAQQKGIPAFDKNHLIAAIPADLPAKFNPGAQERGPLGGIHSSSYFWVS